MRQITETQFTDEDGRWRAVVERNRRADGCFFYAVKTTGIFCRPSCAARKPLRRNVLFYADVSGAKGAGFRACKRCAPEEATAGVQHRGLVVAACRSIERSERDPRLPDLARAAGLSPSHFSKLFKGVLGLTPKQYAMAHRARVAGSKLGKSRDVTSAIYESGYASSSRFYGSAMRRQGMTATDLRKGAAGIEIRYAFGESTLGSAVVAATSKGICAVLLGGSHEGLAADLRGRFPKAVLELADSGSDFEVWVERTLTFLDDRTKRLELPIDVRGTAFQELVWRALRDIPRGETASYTDVAKRIGRPKSARAVAGACAANPAALLIPCHRVVRADGNLSGYRWGVELKRALLDRERSR